MKTTLGKAELFALILFGSVAAGCSAFQSPSAEYVKPGELCTDVSDLPDPNKPAQDQSVALRNVANQYGYGGRREESPERLLMQADSYFEQKRYHDSARLYKKYLASADASTASPDLLGTIHYRIGFVASKKTFYSEAKGEYAQALKYSPRSDEYLFAYAKACYESGDYQTADQQFSVLLARSPAYPEARRYYGLTLLEGSNRASALQPLAESVGMLDACALLADKYYEVGELELASQMEAQAIQLAAQRAQPIPRLPHKEIILANAQNATYAQTINAMSAAQGAPQLAQFAASAPQGAVQAVVPQVQSPLVGSTTPQFAVVAPQYAQIAPVQPQAPPPGAQVAPQTPDPTVPLVAAIAPQTQTPVPQVPVPQVPVAQVPVAQSAAPTTSASNAPAEALKVDERRDENPVVAANAPSSAPQSPLDDSTPRYARLAPVPVSENSAVDSVGTSAAPLVAALPNPIPPALQTADATDAGTSASSDEWTDEDWDDSAFATSGAASVQPAVRDDGYRSPQPEIPMPPERPAPSVPATQSPVERYVPIQNPTYTQKVLVGKSFEIAASRLSALEAVERFADEAAESAERVGYLSLSSLKKAATRVGERAPKSVEIRALEARERDVIGMTSIETPASDPKNAARLSEEIERLQSSENEDKAGKTHIKPAVQIGSSNPGLFVATAAVRNVETTEFFRPGSIDDSEKPDQTLPDRIALRLSRRETRRAEIAETRARTDAAREENWARALKLADALDDARLAVEELANDYDAPLPELKYEIDEEAVWDNAAFAGSGFRVKSSKPSGFGDYQPPETAPTPVRKPTYVAQKTETPTRSTAENVPASRRDNRTPEERLEAARRAGAQVVELSPDQYRRAVEKGLGGQAR